MLYEIESDYDNDVVLIMIIVMLMKAAKMRVIKIKNTNKLLHITRLNNKCLRL